MTLNPVWLIEISEHCQFCRKNRWGGGIKGGGGDYNLVKVLLTLILIFIQSSFTSILNQIPPHSSVTSSFVRSSFLFISYQNKVRRKPSSFYGSSQNPISIQCSSLPSKLTGSGVLLDWPPSSFLRFHPNWHPVGVSAVPVPFQFGFHLNLGSEGVNKAGL